MSRLVIVAAIEREVRPLIKNWRVNPREHAGRIFRFFENDDAALVCGGIGAQAARRAAEAAIALYSPAMVYSAGFAGALDPALRVAQILRPGRVINGSDGSRAHLAGGEGVLVTFAAVVGAEQKAKLHAAFAAQIVDMEAASVARVAEMRGVGFGVVKAISDEFDFSFPSMESFVDSDGEFLETRFALFAALRPWLWPRVISMARNSQRASQALCDALRETIACQAAVPAGIDAMEAAQRR